MSEVTLQQTKSIAQKANLVLTPEELERFHQDLQSVFSYADKLGEVNTDQSGGVGQKKAASPLREDEVQPSLPVEVALASSSKTSGDFFEVDAILE